MMFHEFVKQSNAIEGIHREPTAAEVDALIRFVGLAKVTVQDLVRFVAVNQPGAMLRDIAGLDVRVGDHIPIPGGPMVLHRLRAMLWHNATPWQQHVDYETLHPFTDGNGRSGRALWLWRMRKAPLGFLHTFYYQTLENIGR